MKLPAILKFARLSKLVFAPGTSRILRIAVIAGLSYCLVMLAATLFLPKYLSYKLKSEVAQQLGRELQLGKLSFNPFRLALTLEQVNLAEADHKTSFLKIEQIYLNASLASVWRGALVLDELAIYKPELHIVRKNLQGEFNFSDILQKVQAMPASPEPVRFAMANLQLAGGQIVFKDLTEHQQMQVQELHLALPFVSNFPSELDIFVEPRLQFRLDNKRVDLYGKSKPFASSHESRLSLNIEKLNLLPYLAYLPEQLALKFKSAALSSQLALIFLTEAGQAQMQVQGQLALHDWHTQDQSGQDLLKFAELKANIQQIDWKKQQLNLTSLSWRAPEVWLELDNQGQLNWQKLWTGGTPAKTVAQPSHSNSESARASTKAANANTPPKSAGWHWLVQQGQIADAKLHLHDGAFAKPLGQRDWQQINLQLHQLSNHADAKAASFDLQFAAVAHKNSKAAEHWKLSGHYSLPKNQLDADLKLQHLQVAEYQAWLQNYLNGQLSGSVSAQARVSWSEQSWRIQQAGLNISDLRFKPAANDDPGLSFSEFKLEQVALDSQKRQVLIGAGELAAWDARLTRDKAGSWNWQSWLKPISSPATASNSTPTAASGQPTWRIETGRMQLRDARLALNDAAIYPTVSLQAEKINLELKNWQSDLAQTMPLNFQAQLGRKAQLKFQGELSPRLEQINLDLDAQALPLASLFPYVSPYLNVSITRARTDLTGKLKLQQILKPELMTLAFDGRFALNNFHALENGAEDDFLQWKGLQADGLHLLWGPQQRALTLEKLALSDFYARLILSEKGKLNLQNILLTKSDLPQESAKAAELKSGQAENATSNKQTVALQVTVNATELKNGNINFTDNFIKPNYTANLTGVGGVIGRFANNQKEPAKVELTGKVDDDAPMVVSGTINPLAQPVFLDIKGSTSGLELPRLTPYAAKYAGYAIEKGKLSVQVAYHLENHHLQAQNDLRLDQLTFGERVESPHATRLPVLLAVALLKDSDGQININLPISGSLSDPQFSVGSIISKVVVNLLTKAVTSPFALLASVFGGGSEELSSLDFVPGSASLDEAAKNKLDTLAKALNNRPGLKLDILGRAHSKHDIPALKELELAEQLREAKWKDQRNQLKGQDKATLKLTADEEARYLQKLYSEAKWDKPKNVLGLAKTLALTETRAALLQHIEIDEADLLRLAQQRADAARDYLEDVAKLNRERMFIIAPKLSHVDDEKKGPQHKVDFSLK